MVKSLLFVKSGGSTSTIARILISRYFQVKYTSVYPWDNIIFYIARCLLIDILFDITGNANFLNPDLGLFPIV